MKLHLCIDMPQPKQARPACPKSSVEDRVREALKCIEDGYDSAVEWTTVNSIYRKLRQLKKPNDRAKNLMKMIEPLLSKFGYHGTDDKSHRTNRKNEKQ